MRSDRFKILENGIVHRGLYFVLGALVALAIIAFLVPEIYPKHHQDLMLLRIKIAAQIMIVFSIVLTAAQFVYNRRWNRKEAAIMAADSVRKRIKKKIDSLEPILNLREIMRNKVSLSVAEIHNLMGVFVLAKDPNNPAEKQYRFVHHGLEVQDDIKNTQSEYKDYCSSFQKVNGKKIENTLLDILNEYEYISHGCLRDIFDIEVIIELMGPNIVTTYNTFFYYIMHLRMDERHGSNHNSKSIDGEKQREVTYYRRSVYQNFEKMSEIIANYKGGKFNLTILSPNEVDKKEFKVPFPKASLKDWRPRT